MGEMNVLKMRSFDIGNPQLSNRVFLILRKNPSATHCGPLQDRIGLRTDFLQVVSLIIAGFGNEQAITRSILVGDDVNASVIYRGAIKKILFGGDADGRCARL